MEPNSKFRHISFDVWQTLIATNPDFRIVRNDEIAKALSVPVDLVETILKVKKTILDSDAEKFGLAQPTHEIVNETVLEIIRKQANDETLVLSDETLDQHVRMFTNAYIFAFNRFPPILKRETVVTLIELRKAGFTLSVASNTNYTSGAMLSSLLHRRGLEFEFEIYSNELGVSKPHFEFFKTVSEGASLIHENIDPSQILHVGDNPICDGEGCSKLGIAYYRVNSPDDIPQLLTWLNE